MKLLSIIIPCYNAEPYINELLDVLNKQINDNVEVIIVDDGSKKPFTTDYKWANVIRQKNGGAAAARNTGIDNATGEYIAFIDADDLVVDNYITTITKKIESEHFDYCYLSWKAFGGWNCDVKLKTINDKFPPFNLCLWNRIMKKDMIGNVRLNTNKPIAEDAEFIRDVKEEGKKKAFIGEYMYLYRSNTPNSLTKRFGEGKLDMRRVVYNFKKITPDMDYLIEETKELDKVAEVIIMTTDNQISELEQHAMVMMPSPIKGTELRGEPTNLFTKIDLPIKTQVVIYTSKTYAIGGIETFTYNFCMNMKDLYDIIVLYDIMDINQINRLRKHVCVMKNDVTKTINCDTLIVNRITDKNPPNVIFKQKVQMVHSCKLENTYKIPTDNDYLVPVSQAAYESYNTNIPNCHVINNMTYNPEPRKILKLISATRLTFEKGEDRMIKLARKLESNKIPFLWYMFTEKHLKENVPEIIYMKPTLNIRDYIADSDYLVQLSDSEGFCYSIVEALELGVPVITTPITVLDEIGFKNDKCGYTIPFDVNVSDEFINNLYQNIPKVNYKYSNKKRIQEWQSILGDTTPVGGYYYNGDEMVRVKCIVKYYSMALEREINVGEILEVTCERANELTAHSVATILK